jgi:folylpolyglutamate synthase/dihydropteroate synthase
LRAIHWTDAVLVFGALADKDVTAMLEQLTGAVASIVCTTAASPRAESAERLAAIASRMLPPTAIHIEPDPALALALAQRLSHRVVVAGSIFLIGPLRGILR